MTAGSGRLMSVKGLRKASAAFAAVHAAAALAETNSTAQPPCLSMSQQLCSIALCPHHAAATTPLHTSPPSVLYRPRAVKLMAVLVALLTPGVVEDLVQLAKTVLTDERLTRWALAYVLTCGLCWRLGLHAACMGCSWCWLVQTGFCHIWTAAGSP